MPQPRKSIISLDDSPFYHCIARCVRRAFLCGVDSYSGIDYEHRHDWLEDKLHQTAEAPPQVGVSVIAVIWRL